MGNWQISDRCCGSYSCRQGSTSGTAYCMCPQSRSLEARGSESGREAENNALGLSPRSVIQAADTEAVCDPGVYACWGSDNANILVVCGADRQWHISADCGSPGSCKDGAVPGTAYCSSTASSRSLDSASSPRFDDSPADRRDTDPTPGPEDPDEPEYCTPGRLTCGDRDSKVYGCNSKHKWVLFYECVPSTNCMRGQHHSASCMGNFGSAGKAMMESTDRVTIVSEEGVEGTTTLLTVTKDPASTAKAKYTMKRRLGGQG